MAAPVTGGPAPAGPVPVTPGPAPVDDIPALRDLLGLRSLLVSCAIGALAGSYVLAVAGTAQSMSATAWLVLGGTLTVQLLCVFTTIAIPAEPLPRWAAAMIGAVSLGALGVAWWQAPPTTQWWVQVTGPPAMVAVVAAIFALRGRTGLAWLVLLGAMAVAAAWSQVHGETAADALAMTKRILGTVLPATVIAWMLRPMLEQIGTLRERELAAVREEAENRATARERADRLRQMEGEVDPILRRLAAGGEFTEEEALRARLLEYSLRDEVRGRGWYSAGVRLGAAAARERGVAVQLFDDGGLDVDELSGADAERLRGELVRALTGADRGTVTARILPKGRDVVAVITVGHGDRVERRTAALTAAGIVWSTSASDQD